MAIGSSGFLISMILNLPLKQLLLNLNSGIQPRKVHPSLTFPQKKKKKPKSSTKGKEKAKPGKPQTQAQEKGNKPHQANIELEEKSKDQKE